MEIEGITVEAPGVRTFRLKYRNGRQAAAFEFRAGQFGEYSVFGEGEFVFCIASFPARKGYVDYGRCNVGKLYVCKDGPVFMKT